MKPLIEKLKKIAGLVAAEKPKLHFFGLVHRVDAPDRWDLIVSSDQLAPWSMDALNYIAQRLKTTLSVDEIVMISRIVALPRNHKVITDLTEKREVRPGELSYLHPFDRFDRAVIIWPNEVLEGKPQKVKAHNR